MTQLYPAAIDPKTLSRQVWGSESARAIPGMGRGLQLYGGLIGQMPIDDYRGTEPMPRPRLLGQPDLELDRFTFVAVQVEDYLLHGNAAHLVTARDSDGHPAAVRYYPAFRWAIVEEPGVGIRWYLDGRQVNERDVVHVQRGVDPLAPHRGVGVVEQHVKSLDRAALQEESERENLRGGGVPSVAVVAPQKELTQPELDEAGAAWEEKFRGPGRRPAIFPDGTKVIPLSWSPEDQQATLARQMTLVDVANILNLDSYWLGAPGSSHTYRSAGPLFLMLLRTSLNGVLGPFEGVWSQAWRPRGHDVRFDRQAVLTDDLPTTVKALTTATGRPVMTVDEARTRHLGMAALGGDADELAAAAAPGNKPDDSDDEAEEEQEDEAS